MRTCSPSSRMSPASMPWPSSSPTTSGRCCACRGRATWAASSRPACPRTSRACWRRSAAGAVRSPRRWRPSTRGSSWRCTGPSRARPACRRTPTARALDAFAGLLASRLGVEAARRRAEDARARMASLVDAGLSLGRELALDDLLQRIVQAARTVLGARYAALGVLDATGTELARFVTAGLTDEQREAIGPLPRGRGILGVLIRDARPLRLERLGDDPRSSGFPANHPPMDVVPRASRSPCAARPSATSTSPTRPAGPFTEEDEQIALTLAAQAAVAVDNVRRFESERRRADEIESVTEVARAVLTTLDVDALLPARRAARPAPDRRRDDRRRRARRRRARVPLRARRRRARAWRGAAGRRTWSDLAAALRASLGRPRGRGLRAGGGRRDGRGARGGGLAALRRRAPGACSRPSRARWPSPWPTRGAWRASASSSRRRRGGRPRRPRSGPPAEGLRRAVEAQEAERARVARELHDESGQVLTALALHLRALEERRRPGGRCASGSPRCAASSPRRRRACASWPRACARPPSRSTGCEDAIEEQAARLRRERACRWTSTCAASAPSSRRRSRPCCSASCRSRSPTSRATAAPTRASVVVSARGGRAAPGGRGRRPRLRHRPRRPSRLGLAGIRERVELLGGRPAHRVVPRTAAPPWSSTWRPRERARSASCWWTTTPSCGPGLRLLLEREEGLEPVGEAGTAEDALRVAAAAARPTSS